MNDTNRNNIAFDLYGKKAQDQHDNNSFMSLGEYEQAHVELVRRKLMKENRSDSARKSKWYTYLIRHNNLLYGNMGQTERTRRMKILSKNYKAGRDTKESEVGTIYDSAELTKQNKQRKKQKEKKKKKAAKEGN